MKLQHAGTKRRHSRAVGFTLFELLIVIALVAVFAGILLGRFLQYQEVAEKAAMEQTAGAIRSALHIQAAALFVRGRADKIPELAALNPITLLADKQRNYAGEYYDTTGSDIAPGSWYYDLKNRELVYLVEHGAHFVSDKDGRKRVRYRASLVYNDGLPLAREATGAELGGISFREVEPYVWSPG